MRGGGGGGDYRTAGLDMTAAATRTAASTSPGWPVGARPGSPRSRPPRRPARSPFDAKLKSRSMPALRVHRGQAAGPTHTVGAAARGRQADLGGRGVAFRAHRGASDGRRHRLSGDVVITSRYDQDSDAMTKQHGESPASSASPCGEHVKLTLDTVVTVAPLEPAEHGETFVSAPPQPSACRCAPVRSGRLSTTAPRPSSPGRSLETRLITVAVVVSPVSAARGCAGPRRRRIVAADLIADLLP